MLVEHKFTPEEKLKRGIINLQKPQPFFAHLLMALKVREMSPDFPMQTMGINARGDMFYSKAFVETLTMGKFSGIGRGEEQIEMGEVEGCICHEVLHCALDHFSRMGGRERDLSNIAQDIAINAIVLKNRMPLPKGTIPVDVHRDISEFDLDVVQTTMKNPKKVHIKILEVSKKPWEQIYNEMLEQMEQQGVDTKGGAGNGEGKGRFSIDGKEPGFDYHDRSFDGLSEKEKKEIRDQWGQRLSDAATYAKQQGKLPEGMERFIDHLIKSKVGWKELLRRHLKTFITPVDWAYNKPSRKSHALEMFLPNTVKESVEVEVIVDTSGSIGKDELTEFISEIVAMAKAFSHVRMWITFVDCQVHNRYEIHNGEIDKIMKVTPKGGGGTSMEVGLDYVKKNNGRVPVVVVLTDAYDSFSRKQRDYPFEVIWCVCERGNKNAKIPYGIVVNMGE